MIDFVPADIGYLHWAFQDAINEAKARAEKGMTHSAEAYQSQAANIKRPCARLRVACTRSASDPSIVIATILARRGYLIGLRINSRAHFVPTTSRYLLRSW